MSDLGVFGKAVHNLEHVVDRSLDCNHELTMEQSTLVDDIFAHDGEENHSEDALELTRSLWLE